MANPTNKASVKHFPKAKLKRAMRSISDARGAEETASESRSETALSIVNMAAKFAEQNAADGVPHNTILEGWREHVGMMALELAADGNKFAEAVTNKAGDVHGKLTGYGNNVFSTARGVIEFEVPVSDTYRKTQDDVQEARKLARYEADPEAKALDDARKRVKKSWTDLYKAVSGRNNVALLTALADTLDKALSELPKAQNAEAAGEAETVEQAKAA